MDDFGLLWSRVLFQEVRISVKLRKVGLINDQFLKSPLLSIPDLPPMLNDQAGPRKYMIRCSPPFSALRWISHTSSIASNVA